MDAETAKTEMQRLGRVQAVWVGFCQTVNSGQWIHVANVEDQITELVKSLWPEHTEHRVKILVSYHNDRAKQEAGVAVSIVAPEWFRKTQADATEALKTPKVKLVTA